MSTKLSEIPKGMGVSGQELLNLSLLNKGTAFTKAERIELGLDGLLPPHVETLEEQLVRAYEAYQRKNDDLERHIYLRALQDTNEVLFYRLLLDHIEELTPIVYTPVVASGRLKPRFSSAFRPPAGRSRKRSCERWRIKFRVQPSFLFPILRLIQRQRLTI